MLPLRTIAFLIYFFGFSAASLLVPVLGVANYIIIYQVYPEHAWWHQSLASMGIRYSMTSAVCMMLGILINLPRMPAVRPLLSFWDVLAGSLVLIVLLGEFTGTGPSADSAVLTDKFVKMMIFVFCLTRVTTTRRAYMIVIWALVFGSLYIGYDAWTAPRGAFARGRLEVVGGPDFRHSSGLAAHMSAMLPLIAAAFLTTRSIPLRAVSLISGALTVNTVILCRTRSAFVGLSCGLLAALVLAPKRRRMKIYGAIAGAGVCAFALTDNLFWERMATLQNQEGLRHDNAAMGRLVIWRNARDIIAEHPLGVGIGNFPETVALMNPEMGRRAAHNTFVLCATELGLQGIAILVVLIGVSVVQALRCSFRADQTPDPAWTRYMAYASLLSIVISLGTQMFTERLYTESFWWVLALPGCLHRVVLRETAKKELPLEQGVELDLERWSWPAPIAGGDARGAFA